MQISFTIPGRVRGKGRPRAVVRPGTSFVSVYTDPETRNCETLVRNSAHDAMGEWTPFDGPIELTVAIFQLVPPSWSKKKTAAAFYLTGKPDLDNVVKLIGDALNGIVWRDDSQISDLHVKRRYIRAGQERVEITITELTEPCGVMAESHPPTDVALTARLAAPRLPLFT